MEECMEAVILQYENLADAMGLSADAMGLSADRVLAKVMPDCKEVRQANGLLLGWSMPRR